MQSLYQSKILCISKSQTDDKTKRIYQKRLLEIFQNERKSLNFIITPYEFIDPQYQTVKSTIKFYRKSNYIPGGSSQNNKQEEDEKKKFQIEEEKKKNDKEEIKRLFCSLNKNENFKNISFLEQIGTFYEKTFYFIKYISNAKIENAKYDTKIVEISRCGYNMGNILKNIGYTEKRDYSFFGYFYQYKYYPIICFYIKFGGEKHIFLQIIGFYTESTKKEIIDELDKIKEQISELFYIK